MTGLFNDLRAVFSPDQVHWRVGATTKDKSKGIALAYIDARDVMERLDAVCWPDGWQDSYTETAKGRIICTIQIKIDNEWISKSDGAGDTDVEGDKGAMSDAFKRAAVKWGIGRYLYDIDSPWVPLEAAGNSYKIAASAHPALARALGGNAPKPDEKKPEEPPHVKQAQNIIRKAASITSQEEYETYYDGIVPQLEELKQASTKAYEHVMAQLNKREATLKRETA